MASIKCTNEHLFSQSVGICDGETAIVNAKGEVFAGVAKENKFSAAAIEKMRNHPHFHVQNEEGDEGAEEKQPEEEMALLSPDASTPEETTPEAITSATNGKTAVVLPGKVQKKK